MEDCDKAPKRRKKHIKFYGLLLMLIILCILIVFVICQHVSKPAEISMSASTDHSNETISIPGFIELNLQADTQQQTISLYNPAENDCWFEISLLLEDGTLLWKSEWIAPGDISKPIFLEKSLEAGTYTRATLQYKCFKRDESLAPLNGAEAKVTLLVKE